MDRIRTPLAQSLTLRFVLAAIALIAIAWPFLPPWLKLEVFYTLGFFGPALVIGAIVGFISYNKRVWGMTTLGLFLVTALAWTIKTAIDIERGFPKVPRQSLFAAKDCGPVSPTNPVREYSFGKENPLVKENC